jgi:hypothetical protein
MEADMNASRQQHTYTIVHAVTGTQKAFTPKLISFLWKVEVITTHAALEGGELEIFSLEEGRHEWSRIIGNDSGWRFA